MKDSGLQLPLHEKVQLLTWDSNGVLALDKGAGVLSHPNDRRDADRSLLKAAWVPEGAFYEFTLQNGRMQRAYLLNRLDSATSGVILLSLAAGLANSIRLAFMKKQVRKVYNALVFGQPSERSQIWRDRLNVSKQKGHIRTEAGKQGIPSEAAMRVLRQWRKPLGAMALLELIPKTGRSHQLRVQCAKRGLPIIGDATYGDFRLNREFARQTSCKRLFLHSLETVFEYEWAGKHFHFEAKAGLPNEFQAF